MYIIFVTSQSNTFHITLLNYLNTDYHVDIIYFNYVISCFLSLLNIDRKCNTIFTFLHCLSGMYFWYVPFCGKRRAEGVCRTKYEKYNIVWTDLHVFISDVYIWRNCYHLANLHSGHVGRTPAAIAYIVYIGKNKLKPNSTLVHVQTQEARITIYSACPHRSNRPKFSFIDT